MKILILDQTLIQKAILSIWDSLSFTRRMDGTGEFELVINANAKQSDVIELGQIIYLDAEVCGYIDRIERVSAKNMANESLIISGIELKDIIKSRITYPPSGQDAYTYTQINADTIAMDLIDKLIINPTDTRKKISIFRAGGTSTVGSVIDYSTRLKPLGTQVFELLAKDKLGLKCNVDLDTHFVYFSTFKGADRTINQSANARAIFALGYGTLSKAVTLMDASFYRNVGYVGGSGEGATRTLVELPENNALSGFNRWETFVDASDAQSDDELTARGESILSIVDQTITVRGDVTLDENYVYDLGDFVTVKDRANNYENVQITGVTQEYTGNKVEKRKLIFGKAPLTIAKAIDYRLAGLRNIITK